MRVCSLIILADVLLGCFTCFTLVLCCCKTSVKHFSHFLPKSPIIGIS